MDVTAKTLNDVLAFVGQNDRVCPMPQQWKKLYELLPDKRRDNDGWQPSLPLILAAWHDAPALLKILRLKEHIEWANDHGALDSVAQFLYSLSEDEWHHLGD